MPGKSGGRSDDAKLAALKLGFTSGTRMPQYPKDEDIARAWERPWVNRGVHEGMPVLSRETTRQAVGGGLPAGSGKRGTDATRQRMRNFDERVLAPRIAQANAFARANPASPLPPKPVRKGRTST